MKFIYKYISLLSRETFIRDLALLNYLHILNDGSKVALLLLLPFIAKDIHINLTQVGIIGTIVSTCGIIFSLFAGYISTTLGGYRTLTIALFLYGLGFLATGFGAGYYLLISTYLLAGVGFGVFHPIGFAIIAKGHDKKTIGKIMGNFTALGDIGTITIPAILTLLVTAKGWRIAAIFFALFYLVISLSIYIFRFAKYDGNVETKDIVHIPTFHYVRNKEFVFAVIATTLDTFASNAMFIFLPFLLLAKGINPIQLGLFSAAFFIGSFVGKALLGRFVDRFGNAKVFITAEFFMALILILFTQTNTFIVIMFFAILAGIFTKGTVPAGLTMISSSIVQKEGLDKAFSINGFFNAFASALSPLFYGYISDKKGIATAFIVMAGFALLASVPVFIGNWNRFNKLLFSKIITPN